MLSPTTFKSIVCQHNEKLEMRLHMRWSKFTHHVVCADLNVPWPAQVFYVSSYSASAIAVAGLLVRLFLVKGNQTTLISRLAVFMALMALLLLVFYLCNVSLLPELSLCPIQCCDLLSRHVSPSVILHFS